MHLQHRSSRTFWSFYDESFSYIRSFHASRRSNLFQTAMGAESSLDV
jgi:hypothetical protein